MITLTFMSVDWMMSLEPALHVDDLRHPDARRPGPVDAGLHDSRARGALALQAGLGGREPRSLPRPRQADARLRRCCGRTSTSRSSSSSARATCPKRSPGTSTRITRPVGADRRRGARRPLRAAVRAAAVARPEAQGHARSSRIALFVLVMRVVDLIWTIGPIFRRDGATISLAGLRRRARHGRRLAVRSSTATSPAARSCRRTIRTSRTHWLMADTKHAHAAAAASLGPIEGDGISYSRHRLVRARSSPSPRSSARC